MLVAEEQVAVRARAAAQVSRLWCGGGGFFSPPRKEPPPMGTCECTPAAPASTSNMVLTVVYILAGLWTGLVASGPSGKGCAVPASWLKPVLLRQMGRAMSSEWER